MLDSKLVLLLLIGQIGSRLCAYYRYNIRIMSVTLRSKERSKNLGTILVTYGNEGGAPKLLDILVTNKRKNDFIVVYDNHPDHKFADIADSYKKIDLVIRSKNIGFASACNNGSSRMPTNIGVLLIINPDVIPLDNAINILRDQGFRKNYDAWMGLLILPNGKINSAGNIVHMSGLSWCSNYNESINRLNSNDEVVGLSGACLMIKRNIWEQFGGFYDKYFMYYEDTDLSLRLLKSGMKLGIVNNAVFEHDYEFNKSPQKWFFLERNRYIFIARQWPLALIVLFIPFFFITELGLWLVSIVQGRFIIRTRAFCSFLIICPKIIIERFHYLNRNSVTSSDFLKYLTPKVSTPLLKSFSSSKLINRIFKSYYLFVIFLCRFNN